MMLVEDKREAYVRASDVMHKLFELRGKISRSELIYIVGRSEIQRTARKPCLPQKENVASKLPCPKSGIINQCAS